MSKTSEGLEPHLYFPIFGVDREIPPDEPGMECPHKTVLMTKKKEYPHYVDCTSKRSFIGDINEHALFADGFDSAIVGYDASSYSVVYDYDKCLKVLMEKDDRMRYPEAHEFMEFNVVGAYVGDFTPIFVHSLV